MKVTGQRRKAISPIVATVLIVAAVLIAFAFLATYVFGLLGGSAATPKVTISGQTSISHTAPGTFTAYFLNTGTANSAVKAATMSFGGATCPLTISTGGTLVAGSTSTVYFSTSGCAGATTGESFLISVVLADGSSISFPGMFT